MQTYTRQDLNNFNSSQKQNELSAEKTFITVGEGVELVAYRLSDIIEIIKGLTKKSKIKTILGKKK